MMSEFHFLRPEFLWLIPLVFVLALVVSQTGGSSNWSQYISADKLKLLTRGEASRQWKNPLLLSLAGLICGLALAGPSWEQRPVPTTENASALIVLLDLSPSMLAQDVQPDRLVRARLKITDLLRLREDGQTGLVAYSGSAHRVSPLTDDSNTIEALLPALHPSVMPQTGSNIEAAIELGLELLASSGFQNQGHVLVVTDGIAPEAQKNINDTLPAGVQLSILGVGTVEGAPIPLGGGNFYRDSRGDIVLARLNRNELQILAGRSGGRYIELQPDDSDINYLLNYIDDPSADIDAEVETTYDSWHDAGYWLIFLLIPLALLAFRKDYLFALPVLLVVAMPSPEAEAGIWEDLWYSKDQQAQKALEQGDAASAVELFESSDWKGYAAYQAEEFDSAVDLLQQTENTSLYNLGTSQARAGQLEQALQNLNQFVEANPDHENARFNRDLVEQLLQQEQEQQQENQQQDQQDSDQDQSENGEQADSGESEQSDSEDRQQSGQDEGSESDQQSQQQASEANEGDQEQNQQSQQQAGAESEEEAAEQEEQSAIAEAENQSEQQQNSEQEQAVMAEVSPEDLSDASEQWLRAIPDDPSGLLRRKFEYESQLYQQQRRFIPPNSRQEEPRY